MLKWDYPQAVEDYTQLLPPPKQQQHTANKMYTSEHVAKKKAAHSEVDKQEIAWLEERAAKMPGYEAFMSSRGRTLQNAEVVASWQFAVTFTAQYVGKLSGAMVSSTICICFCCSTLVMQTGIWQSYP